MTNEETRFWDAAGNFGRAAICRNWEQMERQFREMLVYHRLAKDEKGADNEPI